jgi:hypothetical protein
MLHDNLLRLSKLARRKTVATGEFDGRLQPVLRLAVGARNMNVRSHFFSGKEEEPIASLSVNRRRHTLISILALGLYRK